MFGIGRWDEAIAYIYIYIHDMIKKPHTVLFSFVFKHTAAIVLIKEDCTLLTVLIAIELHCRGIIARILTVLVAIRTTIQHIAIVTGIVTVIGIDIVNGILIIMIVTLVVIVILVVLVTLIVQVISIDKNELAATKTL